MFDKKFYASSPPWLQEYLISSRAFTRNLLRERKIFKQLVQEIHENEYLSENEIREYQLQHLKTLLEHASIHVPYYRNIFSELGISTNTITLEDIQRIPFLTKQIVLEQGPNILANNMKYGRIKGSTSGTTGTPLTLYQNLYAVNRENAFRHRQLTWAGHRNREPRAWIRGDMVVPSGQSTPPFWRQNYADNMLMMSSYHLSNLNAPLYINQLERFNPVLIQAYPSSVGFLASFLDAKNLDYRGSSLRAIVTSSETVTSQQREVIERRFGCKIFDWYGSFERVSAIGTCEKGNYHVMSDYAFTELIPSNDGTVEIVGTGFNNLVMPLIRYKTSDTVVLPEDNFTCACGRSFPMVKKILGRSDDYIVTPDGRRIGRLDHVYKGLRHIAEAQIVQDTLKEIQIRVVVFEEFSDDDEKKLLANAQHWIGRDVNIQIKRVSDIPRTSNGKFRAVICNLKQ